MHNIYNHSNKEDKGKNKNNIFEKYSKKIFGECPECGKPLTIKDILIVETFTNEEKFLINKNRRKIFINKTEPKPVSFEIHCKNCEVNLNDESFAEDIVDAITEIEESQRYNIKNVRKFKRE